MYEIYIFIRSSSPAVRSGSSTPAAARRISKRAASSRSSRPSQTKPSQSAGFQCTKCQFITESVTSIFNADGHSCLEESKKNILTVCAECQLVVLDLRGLREHRALFHSEAREAGAGSFRFYIRAACGYCKPCSVPGYDAPCMLVDLHAMAFTFRLGGNVAFDSKRAWEFFKQSLFLNWFFL